jgi:hypothetical protein
MFQRGAPGFVGIHYWLERADGSRLSVDRAAPDTPYTLHIVTNTGAFLTVWATADGAELTPRATQWPGLDLKPNGEFVPSGKFRLAPESASARVFMLLARSQTEQVGSVADGLAKLERLKPSIATETVDGGADLGTYVVNVRGAQAAATVRLMR